jgi:hypothetical protein
MLMNKREFRITKELKNLLKDSKKYLILLSIDVSLKKIYHIIGIKNKIGLLKSNNFN